MKNKDVDEVYKILKKFVQDEVVGADFDDPEADAMKTLKRWWTKNKHKFIKEP